MDLPAVKSGLRQTRIEAKAPIKAGARERLIKFTLNTYRGERPRWLRCVVNNSVILQIHVLNIKGDLVGE